MLDLNRVAMFVEVVRAESFSGAARRLGVPPNTLSRNIQQLEHGLGGRLLHRSTRKLTLTAAGRAFFEQCAAPITELSEAGEELLEGTRVPSGLIRVAAPAGFFDSFDIAWVGGFLARYPRVRLEFLLDDAKADLIAESIDVAFRAGNMLDPGTVSRRLADTDMALVASPAYLARQGTPTSVAALVAHDCILQASRSGSVLWRLQGPAGTQEIQVSGRFSANTARAVLQAAIAGLGIALLPEVVASPEIREGRLLAVLPGYRRELGGFHAILPSRRQIPRAVSAFVEFVAEQLSSDWNPQRRR